MPKLISAIIGESVAYHIVASDEVFEGKRCCETRIQGEIGGRDDV